MEIPHAYYIYEFTVIDGAGDNKYCFLNGITHMQHIHNYEFTLIIGDNKQMYQEDMTFVNVTE